MSDFEIGELLEIGKFKVPDTSNPFPDSSVEGDDSTMDAGVGDGEKVDDVLPITGEFMYSVREGESNGSDRSIPGDGPVSSILNHFRGFDLGNSKGSETRRGRG